MSNRRSLATDASSAPDESISEPLSERAARGDAAELADGGGLSQPESAPPPSQVIVSPGDPANDDGDPDAEEDSPAGDRALPLDLEVVAPGNDNVPDPARGRHGQRLASRKLIQRCLAYLMVRHGMNDDDANEVVQDAFVRALCVQRIPDEDGRPIYPWMRRFVNNQRFKFLSKRGKRRSREEQVEDIDVFQATVIAIDGRAQVLAGFLERLEQKSRGHALAIAMLRARETGKTWEEVGEEFGVSPEAAKHRVHRVIAYIRQHAPQLSTLAMGAALILLFLQLRHASPDVKVGDAVHDDGPPLNAPLPPLDAKVTPSDLRARGLTLCEQGQYALCLEYLDRAAAQDPEEAKRPEVIQWRATAEKALHAKDAPKKP